MSEHHERDAFDVRPTAEEMLARIGASDGSGRGRLRVYLGMAPGVGKTYRMLEEGHRRLDRGTDIVVGFVETHGRPRTAALLDGLEVLPRLRVEHRGVTVEEMDVDAVLARRPTVALIDELAHSNVPGASHEKRHEDVEQIRAAGIHVVSTLNIQHLESMASAVETITGAPVRERLPDEILATADEIELVDMSPHALRQRMRHGNVYPADRADIALDRFFTEGNLTALRELSLRVVARRVEDQLEESGVREQGALAQVRDRVAVLADGSPGSAAAVRRAAALASALRAGLLAIVIEPAPSGSDWHQTVATRNATEQAVDLGAEVVRVGGPDALKEAIALIRSRSITRVVVPHRAAGRLERLRSPALVVRLAEALPGVDLLLVSAPPDEPPRR